MKTFKHVLFSLVLVGSLFTANVARAGIPVIDAANLVQSIQQVIAWAQQQAQMLQRIQQAAQEIQSMTGSRNLGQVFNDVLLQGSVPPDLGLVLGSINAQGYAGLTAAAQQIRTASAIYNCLDRLGADRVSCQAALNGISQAQSYHQIALNLQQKRVQEIQNIQKQINQTSDPKGIAEVQAALMAENAQVANDANRIALMQMSIEAQQRAAEQALFEKQLVNVSPTTQPTLTTFQWTLPNPL